MVGNKLKKNKIEFTKYKKPKVKTESESDHGIKLMIFELSLDHTKPIEKCLVLLEMPKK